MPKPIDEDRARRKELLEQKKAARKNAAAVAAAAAKTNASDTTTTTQQSKFSDSQHVNDMNPNEVSSSSSSIVLQSLPTDAMHTIFSMLSVADLGRLLLTGHAPFRSVLISSRTSYVLSRLYLPQPSSTLLTNHCRVELCTTEEDARTLLLHTNDEDDESSTIQAKSRSKNKANHRTTTEILQQIQEFLSYLRFIEEVVTGYSLLKFRSSSCSSSSTITNQRTTTTTVVPLPTVTHGRFVSVSPEHSLLRMGGDTQQCGPCSGCASFGVGKRGQLGHNKRQDARTPIRLRYGIGYTLPELRIVQVSAGGGLVRVAHSLLLTSTGRVLSFGTGQYGALGHGYNAAKQLPDCLKPTYIEALSHVTCVCVAAGELHSAVVTSDGDVYTFGDGFCGQLGHGDKRPITTPKQITSGGLDEECVVNITCGGRHTLAVTEDGDCYSWGLGHFGVLGRSFTPFEYDADTAVHTFASMAATGNNGGDNDIDQSMQRLTIQDVANNAAVVEVPPIPRFRDTAAELAAHLDLIANLTLDDSSDQCIPKVVDTLQGIRLVGASAGHRHSLFLDASGHLYSSGAGGSGCLGHGNTETCMYPCRISAMKDDDETEILFRRMSAGVDISMAVSTDGTVYGWGKTEGGRIGLGMAKSQITVPRRVYLNDTTKQTIASPTSRGSDSGKVENDSVKYKAVDVDCGYVHSIIVALDGTTYICGGVGVEGEDDGQQHQVVPQDANNDDENDNQTGQNSPVQAVSNDGRPKRIPGVNVWRKLPEPKDEIIKKERWQKMGKYEVKGRSKMS
jgi:alpha-tubulin suppressor-like RCC1 family protein